jgi:hypothetical protein
MTTGAKEVSMMWDTGAKKEFHKVQSMSNGKE